MRIGIHRQSYAGVPELVSDIGQALSVLYKQVGVFDENKNEDCVPIRSLNDIYVLADRLKAAAKRYPAP